MIFLHGYDTPNARKISVALEEMDLDYRVVIVDIKAGEQFTPEFQGISPNARIPAIVDDDAGTGSPVSVFESGAILIYIAEKSGRFLPREGQARIETLEWLMWQVGGFGPMLGQVHHFAEVSRDADRAYGLARYLGETRRLYGVLERRLDGLEYVAGELSIADFAILGWAWRHTRHRISLSDFPNVERWYGSLMGRPGVERGMTVALSNAGQAGIAMSRDAVR